MIRDETMNLTEIRLRRALYQALRFYQRPVSQKNLRQNNLPWPIWKQLAKHGCLKSDSYHQVTLSDHGLQMAQKWFPALAQNLSHLDRICPIKAVMGHVWLIRVDFNGNYRDTGVNIYRAIDGGETNDITQAIFILDHDFDWKLKKSYQDSFPDDRMLLMSQLVSKDKKLQSSRYQVPPELEGPKQITDYSDFF